MIVLRGAPPINDLSINVIPCSTNNKNYLAMMALLVAASCLAEVLSEDSSQGTDTAEPDAGGRRKGKLCKSSLGFSPEAW